MDFFRLVCTSQYLRIRDGDSLASELIAEYIGGNDDQLSKSIISAESQLLLEFYSNDLSTLDESCRGGFLIHAQQIRKCLFFFNKITVSMIFFKYIFFIVEVQRQNSTVPQTSKAIMPIEVSPIAIKLTLVHITAILFASIIIVVSALLGKF